MSRLEDAKKKYDKTEIPKELSKRVQAAVEESGARKREREKRYLRENAPEWLPGWQSCLPQL